MSKTPRSTADGAKNDRCLDVACTTKSWKSKANRRRTSAVCADRDVDSSGIAGSHWEKYATSDGQCRAACKAAFM